jgi:NADPH:quinone reductase-like Zn-dependent oxidoreductase
MAPTEQTAVQVVGKGENYHEVLRVATQPVVPPEQGEVLVRVQLRPINPADVYKIQGKNPVDSPFSWTPGNEGMGVVEENGEGASKFRVGQRVVAASWPGHAGVPANGRPFGTFQQYLVVPEKDLLAVPDELDDASAAQFFINPTTAYGMIQTLDVPKGEWLLQSAAGSVVGRTTIAIAKRKGIRTINLVRRREQVQELLDLGADEVICTADEDVKERVMQITEGRGAYGATDAVGGKITTQIIASLRKGGTVLIYGLMSGGNGEYDILDVLYGGKTITGFAVLRWTPQQKAAGTWAEHAEEIMKLFLEGVIRTPAGKVYALEQAADAVEESMRHGKGDKVLLKG